MIRWYWHDQHVPETVRALFERGDWRAAGFLIKQTRQRRIYYYPPMEGQPGFYLKEERPGKLWRWCGSPDESASEREFRNACRLQEAGIPVVRHLGFGCHRLQSWLLTEEAGGSRSLAKILADGDMLERQRHLLELARLLNRLLASKLGHGDLHGSNFLAYPRGLVLIDAEDIIPLAGLRDPAAFLAEMLWYPNEMAARHLPPRLQEEFWQILFAGLPEEARRQEVIEACRRQRAELLANPKILSKVVGRYFTDSTDAEQVFDRNGQWFVRKQAADFSDCLGLLRRIREGQFRLLVRKPGVRLFQIQHNAQEFLFCEYRPRLGFFWHPAGREAWKRLAVEVELWNRTEFQGLALLRLWDGRTLLFGKGDPQRAWKLLDPEGIDPRTEPVPPAPSGRISP